MVDQLALQGSTMPSALTPFDTVPEKDYHGFGTRDHFEYDKVVVQLGLKKEEISKATGVPLASIRYEENKIPQELRERIIEWGTLLNLVAQHFQGDLSKTALWFTMPNPLLGNTSPRDMIRFGRYKKLFNFVLNAIAEGKR